MYVLWLLLTLAAPAVAQDESLARQILEEINLARNNPQVYVDYLREFRSRFQGASYTDFGSRDRVLTSEGVAAVDEAIRFLTRQKTLPPLIWSRGLGAAASELVREQGKSGTTGHGERGDMRRRIERQGTWGGRIAENIVYGPTDARAMVLQLIVDDGVPGRGHRKNQFNPVFGTAEVACGPHPRFGTMCSIDFAGTFREQ
ncbi:MAG: CAP domain-containing protein [Desulfuromonadales bacterium]|nr:CAP domain-containing protein [Desulfuromonadales bacterium]